MTPIVVKQKQHGSGNHGWHSDFILAMREKLTVVLEYTRSESVPFVYCDADVRFNPILDPVPTLLNYVKSNEFDIVCQRDGEDICMGFMLINPSEKNANYLQSVLNYMDSNPSKCDQLAFKELYHSGLYLQEKPRIKLLDINSGFGNMNHLQPGVLWNSENTTLELHKQLIQKQFMWHANHTIGVKNKMDMLDRFQKICENTYT
jgi:hypothetical protein